MFIYAINELNFDISKYNIIKTGYYGKYRCGGIISIYISPDIIDKKNILWKEDYNNEKYIVVITPYNDDEEICDKLDIDNNIFSNQYFIKSNKPITKIGSYNFKDDSIYDDDSGWDVHQIIESDELEGYIEEIFWNGEDVEESKN